MSTTRREFIKGVALAIAALAAAQCAPPGGWDDSGQEDSPQARQRRCWLRIDSLAQQTQKDHEKGDTLRGQLVAEHRAALDDLVGAGIVDAAVADEMQAAYVEAAYHVWRANAPITCYEPMEFGYTPVGADQLVQQANLLAEMAESGNLDAATVARAQAAIERDVAFLALSDEELQALYDRLRQAGGRGQQIPSFEQLELEVPPEAVEAAHFLVDLLTQQP